MNEQEVGPCSTRPILSYTTAKVIDKGFIWCHLVFCIAWQIVRMERQILKTLDFNLLAPTTHTFLLRYLKAAEAEQLLHVPSTIIAASIHRESTAATMDTDSVATLIQDTAYLAMVSCIHHITWHLNVNHLHVTCLFSSIYVNWLCRTLILISSIFHQS